MRIPELADVDEFVRWEEQQEERYEFAEGEVSPFPGAMPRHGTIVVNLLAALRVVLGAGHVYGSGLKLVMQNSSRYPDVLVSFDPRDGIDSPHLRYPTLVVEVLSKSTSATDRGPKADEYRDRNAPRVRPHRFAQALGADPPPCRRGLDRVASDERR
jgi:Uma2 family endonuclease